MNFKGRILASISVTFGLLSLLPLEAKAQNLVFYQVQCDQYRRCYSQTNQGWIPVSYSDARAIHHNIYMCRMAVSGNQMASAFVGNSINCSRFGGFGSRQNSIINRNRQELLDALDRLQRAVY
ncbi:MAG: hypothetical protein SAJ37_04560 [Oscillatoria sp. PMC 1068.18]|nr:hypothetical protein [Oscillatoria sp. PMC 1076.18]MEC4988001.1 hypothetical protein [Oscillatoria sp. PMC 1068.18]